jgi:hypothetical protein
MWAKPGETESDIFGALPSARIKKERAAFAARPKPRQS